MRRQHAAPPSPVTAGEAGLRAPRHSADSRTSSHPLAPASIRPLAPTDEIIEAIYKGPLEASPWQSFLRLLRLRMDAEVAAISLRPGRAWAPPIIIWDRRDALDQHMLKLAAGEHARLLHLDPLRNALLKPGDIFTLDEVISREALVESEIYEKLIKPYGIEYQLGMYFSEPGGWECSVGLMNSVRGRNFGDAEKSFFIGFRPHLERALEIYARLKRNESEKEILEQSFDRLTIGTIILDGRGQIIGANTAAERIARQSDCISFVGKAVSLSNPESNARLQRAIKDATAWREQGHTHPFVAALRVDCPSGPNVGFLVRATPLSLAYPSDVSPSVVIYLADSAQQQLASERLVAQLFGLSSSEAFLATLLADGFTLSEAAKKLDVTENTVRNYAKKVFAKTGVSRQADLVRLILKSVALLA